MKSKGYFRRVLFASMLSMMLLLATVSSGFAQTNTITRCKNNPYTGQEVCITYNKTIPPRPEKTPLVVQKAPATRLQSAQSNNGPRFQVRIFRFRR